MRGDVLLYVLTPRRFILAVTALVVRLFLISAIAFYVFRFDSVFLIVIRVLGISARSADADGSRNVHRVHVI